MVNKRISPDGYDIYQPTPSEKISGVDADMAISLVLLVIIAGLMFVGLQIIN